MKKYLFILCLAVLCACKHENAPESKDSSVKNGVIELNSASPIIPKLRFQKAEMEEVNPILISSGTVKAIPNNYAQIAAPFAGRITKSFVKLGQKVSPGSPIFEISSAAFYEATNVYYQAKQEMDLAEKNLKRQKDLYKNGVGVQKDLEEAEASFEMKKKNYENSLAGLKVFNVDMKDLTLGRPLVLRSPIRGEIVENNIVLGQYLKEDAQPVVTVAELSKVWVIGQIKEKDISFIKNLQDADIKLQSNSDKFIPGKIYHVNDILDESTRSVQIIIECDNKSKEMKPGMYVSVKFTDTPRKFVTVPATAVFQKDESSFVFVKVSEGKYSRRKVEVSSSENGKVVIKSGINPGEEYVSEGGYYLLEIK
eukprot:TRINITY_DN16191_c0_g1_i1.p1 TRINITY_DN16191_c0_g1~~TRINITY_DN16191_c0_g1_i1.p1  ORF type:complete len:367 (-),score=0.62 TRINITY_DN16191_c0_g1_i1:640-1740(-)